MQKGSHSIWWLIGSDIDSDCTFYGCSLFPYLFLFLTIKDDLIAKYGSWLLPRLIISRLENGHWASFLYLLKEQSSLTLHLTLSLSVCCLALVLYLIHILSCQKVRLCSYFLVCTPFLTCTVQANLWILIMSVNYISFFWDDQKKKSICGSSLKQNQVQWSVVPKPYRAKLPSQTVSCNQAWLSMSESLWSVIWRLWPP